MWGMRCTSPQSVNEPRSDQWSPRARRFRAVSVIVESTKLHARHLTFVSHAANALDV